ncbi:MAG TPA: hypothetical protein VEL31_29560 [Ktedonobacteraceae bacterium]|nr:hypothetical protein [Ktedonobacteraceae bacterium]
MAKRVTQCQGIIAEEWNTTIPSGQKQWRALLVEGSSVTLSKSLRSTVVERRARCRIVTPD